MKRHFFSLLLCLALLAGCGGQEASPLPASETPTVPPAVQATATSAPLAVDSPTPGLSPSSSPSPLPSNTVIAAVTDTPAPTLPPSPTSAPTPTPMPEWEIGSTHVSPRTGMTLVYVPGGEFLRGSSEADAEAMDDEKPQEAITLDGFWIDQTEVTNAMFAAFLDSQGNQEEGGASWYNVNGEDIRLQQNGDAWEIDEGYDDHPVINVTWYGARAYCAWAGERLPSEAEWEKAARGVDGNIYPWGNGAVDEALLNFADDNAGDLDWADTDMNDGYGRTAPAGSYPDGASPYQALDMAGNVWEWVADWYGEAYYAASPSANPPGPANGSLRAARGGSWYDPASIARSAYRGGFDPAEVFNTLGFRCASSEVVAPPTPTATPTATDTPQPTSRPATPNSVFPMPMGVFSLSWSPNGKYLALGGDTMIIWNVPEATFFYSRDYNPNTFDSAEDVQYSPDGYRLAVAYPYQLYDLLIAGAESGSIVENLFAPNPTKITAVDWSPDGRWLAGGGLNGEIYVWDTTTWEVQQTLTGHTDCVNDIAFSPDGKHLASGSSDTTVRIWDTTTWESLQARARHGDKVNTLAWSPDSSLLASGADDTYVFIWDAASGERQASLEQGDDVDRLAWSPVDAHLLATTDGGTIQFWDPINDTWLYQLEADYTFSQVAFSPNGKMLASIGWARGWSTNVDFYLIIWYLQP